MPRIRHCSIPPQCNCQNQQPSDHFNFESTECESADDLADHDSTRQPRRTAVNATDLETLKETDFRDVGQNVDKTSTDIDRIIRQIKSVILFEGYDHEELKAVTSYMYNQKVVSGEVVIQFGNVGTALYVVKSGSYLCTAPEANGEEVEIRSYKDDGYFGELALINRVPRAATITALTDGELWVLCALRCSWLRKRQAVANANQLERVIKAIPMFRDSLDDRHVNSLIDAFEVVSLPAGGVVCRQGEPGDAMYFVMEGEILALIDGKPVKALQANEFFGERALILDMGRAATCCAARDSKLAKLPQESFRLLIPDDVIDKMKAHIAASYGKKAPPAAAATDDGNDDDNKSVESIYIEYLCHDAYK